MGNYRTELISPQQALAGRTHSILTNAIHAVHQTDFQQVPAGMSVALFAMGCFWGAEQLFWQQAGVYSTSVGYCAGYTPNPTYQEVCSGATGHAEAVRVIFAPEKISYATLLALFWENHDPTQGMRQKDDIGSQYRSMILTLSDEQQQLALASRQDYQCALTQHAQDHQQSPLTITTEITSASPFYYAEDYHQQYLFKNPQAHCHIGGVGVCMLK